MSAEEAREIHQPQISKRQVALDKLTLYFVDFFQLYAPKTSVERRRQMAAIVARNVYKIVKRAEGYEV